MNNLTSESSLTGILVAFHCAIGWLDSVFCLYVVGLLTAVHRDVAPCSRCRADTDSVPVSVIQMEREGASTAASGTWARPMGRLCAVHEGASMLSATLCVQFATRISVLSGSVAACTR